ncbi:MAG: glycogen synthase [Gemmatimonadetes bacterium]|nr:glycogen synthase [Gemmatimonadota bacterium]
MHLSAEYWPWVRTGGLAEAVSGLAGSLAAGGAPTTAVLPLYRAVRENGADLQSLGRPFAVPLGSRSETGRLFRLRPEPNRPTVYFIDHPGYFDRAGVYGESGVDYPDNVRRFGFFSAAAVQVLPLVAPEAAILHLHDWHPALASVSVRVHHGGESYYDRLGLVLTVHNAGFQGHFPFESLRELGLPESLYHWRWLEWYGRVNWLKGALAFADRITTVSPTHARELRTEAGGFGLHGAFRDLEDRLIGIVNGIDADCWNPATDPSIAARYSFSHLDGKRRCKTELQAAYRLEVEERVPLIAMTARLVSQKGLPIILEALPSLARDAQFVFLGQGDARFEQALRTLAAVHPTRIAVDHDFHDLAEHRLLAGADLLLMPSLYEPCGLTQMRALRYGAIPVARNVGGLADTVESGITGFLFDEYSAAALERAVRGALDLYATPATWRKFVRAGMVRDFSWIRPVADYLEVYRQAWRASPRREPRPRGGARRIAGTAEAVARPAATPTVATR